MPSRLTVVLSLLLAAPAVAFWLWLVIVPARVAILCPGECECDTGGYFITCFSDPLNAFPFIHLTGVRVLQIGFDNLTLLENNSFVSMIELKFLILAFPELRTIELGAFNGLTKLTDLLIIGNNISDILPGTFDSMSSLEYLDLSENRIEHLNRAVFSGLGAFNGLTKLTRLLMRDNKISDILPGTFEYMSSLEDLDLRSNRIEHLDSAVFSGLVNLKHVDLSANEIQYLHPHTFLGLPNIKRLSIENNVALQIPTDRHFINSHSLSELDISNCNISSLTAETLANVSALKSLDLSYNNLRTVDINILRALPELSELYLYGNPLQCDCQLLEVWRRCEDRNIRTVKWGRLPECDNPIEVKGMWWGVLEKGQCLEGNIQFYGDYNSTSYSETGSGGHEYDYEHGYEAGIFKQNQLTVYAVPFIFCAIGNVMLLIIIISNKDMRTVPNMYILNLAISDIIYVTVTFSEACGKRIFYTHDYGDFTCTFLSFCCRMSVGLSAYSVALYSFQRYRITVKPFQGRVCSQTTWRGIVAEICGVWIVAALFAIPSTLSKYLCQKSFSGRHLTYYQHVVIFELLVSSVLPLCVIAFSYIMTAHHLVRSSRAISEGTQNPQLNLRRSTAKIVVGLTVVFVISYVPYHAFWAYFISSRKENLFFDPTAILRHSNDELQYTYLISNCFLLINSCLNPVALFCTSSLFRKHLKRYLTCFCKTNFPPSDPAHA